MRIRVGVVGATGKMGRVLCEAILDAPDLELVAAVGRSNAGTPVETVIGHGDCGPPIRTDLEALVDASAHVAVDFTHPDVVMPGVIYLHLDRIAARLLDEVELFEGHPPGKAEAPSGTTLNGARARPSRPDLGARADPGIRKQ